MEDTTGRQVTVNLAQATHSGKSTLALTGNISKVYLAVETKLVILFPYTANATSSSEEGEVDQSRPSYEMLLESCSKSLDSEWEIKRTPGQAHGAELPLKILLIYWVSGATCHIHANTLQVQPWQEPLSSHGPSKQDAIPIHSSKYQLIMLSWMNST